MSKLFHDHIVDLSDVEKEIKKVVKDKEAQEELIHLVDELVHHRVVGCILDRLPEKHHEEFVDKLHKAPHDKNILHFVSERVTEDVYEFIRFEMRKLSAEIMAMISDGMPVKKISS